MECEKETTARLANLDLYFSFRKGRHTSNSDCLSFSEMDNFLRSGLSSKTSQNIISSAPADFVNGDTATWIVAAGERCTENTDWVSIHVGYKLHVCLILLPNCILKNHFVLYDTWQRWRNAHKILVRKPDRKRQLGGLNLEVRYNFPCA
jgi:hypothetical protein